MRNGKHYVQVRMTKTEKENFLRLSKLCNAPEKTVLYWLVNDMIVYEKPPETFFKISKLMRRLETNVDHIWLGRSDLSEVIKTKYYKLSKALNNYDCEITYKGLFAEAHYIGVQKRPEIANNEHFSKIDFRINRRPGKLPPVFDNTIDWERYIENRKSSVRCKVEHAFRIIKCQFGYKKTVYKGLKKNENRLYAMFACANLYALAMAKRKLSTV